MFCAHLHSRDASKMHQNTSVTTFSVLVMNFLIWFLVHLRVRAYQLNSASSKKAWYEYLGYIYLEGPGFDPSGHTYKATPTGPAKWRGDGCVVCLLRYCVNIFGFASRYTFWWYRSLQSPEKHDFNPSWCLSNYIHINRCWSFEDGERNISITMSSSRYNLRIQRGSLLLFRGLLSVKAFKDLLMCFIIEMRFPVSRVPRFNVRTIHFIDL